MKTIAMVVMAALALAGCGGTEDEWPDVSTRYAIEGQVVTCDGPAVQEWFPEGGPYTSGYCSFARVSVNGVNDCMVAVNFERDDASADWRLDGIFRTRTTGCD
jgi:hypothetical protein